MRDRLGILEMVAGAKIVCVAQTVFGSCLKSLDVVESVAVCLTGAPASGRVFARQGKHLVAV